MATLESETDDYEEEDDEDLSAPPRKKNPPPPVVNVLKDNGDLLTKQIIDDSGDETLEDEVEELTSEQYNQSRKRKENDPPGEIHNVSKRRKQEVDEHIDGQKIVWEEAEQAAESSKNSLTKRTQSKLKPPKRKRVGAFSTGVGRRRGGLVPVRQKASALNLGTPQHRSFLSLGKDDESQEPTHAPGKQSKVYKPPEPIIFSDLEDENETERPSFDSVPPCPKEDLLLASGGIVPAPISQWLRDYQVEGIEFMFKLWKQGRGGILGDDMGLGKTVQVIAFLTAVFGKKGKESDKKRMREARKRNLPYPRVLVICPKSIMTNWEREFTTWGWWHTSMFHGINKELTLDTARSGRLEVLITTYTTYKQNQEKINMIDWDIVIADECHIIKERTSEVTEKMALVNSRVRIGLTGTAIQNNYEELWNLLDWTNPGGVGSLTEWKTTIAKPLREGQSHDANNRQLSAARKIAARLKENLLPKFMLRRTKSLIADQLPTKTDKVVFCPLTDTQRFAYENLMECDDIELIKRRSEPCDCGSRFVRGACCYTRNADGRRIDELIFPYMVYIQKLSNHIALLIPRNEDGPEKKEKDQGVLDTALPELSHHLCTREPIANYADAELCGKWKVLEKLLQHWYREGSKVLIFSYSVRLLKMLDFLMVQKGYFYEILEGSMDTDERTARVDKFNNDPKMFVFLISTKAGGVGLNIVSANKVVLFDPNWNPAHDLQAQDRAYRIGQLRDVEVFRLVSQGTVEEIVYARQIYKQQQANIGYYASNERRYFKGVQGSHHGELFGLENIFSFDPDRPFLRNVVNKTSVDEQVFAMAELNFSQHERENALMQDADDNHGIRDFAKIGLQLQDGQKGEQDHVDPISAILSSVGVEYTHLNTEIIGPSKVEARISEMASAFAKDSSRGDLRAYLSNHGVGGNQYKIGNVPLDVRKRQFQSMAKAFGYSSVERFALHVEKMEAEQRTQMLGIFYRHRKELLAKMGDDGSSKD